MSIEASTAVHKSSSQGNASDRLLLLILANEAAQDGARCFPGFKTLLKNTRMPKSTLVDALERLETNGWILRHTRGKGHHNHYVLVLNRLEDPDDPDVDENWHCEVCRTAAVRVHETRRRLLAGDGTEADVRRWVAAHVDLPEVDDVDDPDTWFDLPPIPISTCPDTGPPSSADTGPPEEQASGAAHRTTGGPDTGPSSTAHRTRPVRPGIDPGTPLPAAAGEHEHQEIVAALEAHCLSGDPGAVGLAAKQLLAAGATPAEISARATRLRDRWGPYSVTAPALAKWWPSLAGAPDGPTLPDNIRHATALARSSALAGTPWDDIAAELDAIGHTDEAIAAARDEFDHATGRGAA